MRIFTGRSSPRASGRELSGWFGLHYPADDIPKPAREIFKKIWIRPLPDATAPVMELVPLVNPDTSKPLNMTHCSLRGASVMYTEYLQNMGVAASLTMAIHRDGELLGIDCVPSLQAQTFSVSGPRGLRSFGASGLAAPARRGAARNCHGSKLNQPAKVEMTQPVEPA